MKFSVRQILASAAGAVIAAIIASIFGVKGTIVGVAIGSAAATFGTALVAQSIERGQQAVKQVVVRAPESSPLLRKLGATGTGSADGSPSDAAGESTATPGVGAETIETASSAAAEGTDRLEISAVADAPATQRIDATTLPPPPARQPRRPVGSPGFRWTTIAGTAAIVFVIALLFITAIELISGKPLAAIFGNTGGGTTVKNVFTPAPTPARAGAGTDHDNLDPLDDVDDVADEHDDQHDGTDEHHHNGRSRCLDHHHDRSHRVGQIDDDIDVGRALAVRSGVTSP